MTKGLIGGRYEILKKIGEGGMQQVFLARDTSLKRNVALKIPLSASAKRRFDRSAKLSAKVVHPNVAATLDYVRDDPAEYLIEEYIPGSDLQKRFDKDFVALDPHLAAHIVHHLAKGVAAAHHAKVVHRDLKPSNIMVSADAGLTQIKITDFGIAKMTSSVISEEVEAMNKDSSTITGSKTLVGAIPYMAPEALSDSANAAFPADVWAIGAITYWLLAGVPPFGTGLPAVARILGKDTPQKPRSFGQYTKLGPLEEELWSLIAHCMNRDPEKRPTADELVRRLASLCYSAAARVQGVIAQIGIPNNKLACFLESDGKRYFCHRSSVITHGTAAVEGDRVAFTAFAGNPHPRAGLVLQLRPKP